LDYGHNPAAVKAMCTLVDRLSEERSGRRICVLAMPGDRRDEDIREAATRAATSFDHFICRRDDRRRGRGDDEVPMMLRQALLDAGVPEERIEVVVSEVDAVNRGLALACPGDLLLMFCDAITRTWKQVIYFGSDRPETRPQTAEVPKVIEAPAPPPPAEPDGNWVRDTRGVFLAEED
jgi:cyanophycin synthetase